MLILLFVDWNTLERIREYLRETHGNQLLKDEVTFKQIRKDVTSTSRSAKKKAEASTHLNVDSDGEGLGSVSGSGKVDKDAKRPSGMRTAAVNAFSEFLQLYHPECLSDTFLVTIDVLRTFIKYMQVERPNLRPSMLHISVYGM